MIKNSFSISTLKDLLVKIPAGQIELRDDRTKQKWTVEIKPFLLGKYPVTQELYFDIINEKPSTIVGPNRLLKQLHGKML